MLELQFDDVFFDVYSGIAFLSIGVLWVRVDNSHWWIVMQIEPRESKCFEDTKKKKHIPGVLSTRNSMETTVLLKLDYLSDRLVLNGLQLFSISLASSNSITLLHKLIGTQQRANVLGSEGRASLCGRHIG
jgi:hypothetical protein